MRLSSTPSTAVVAVLWSATTALFLGDLSSAFVSQSAVTTTTLTRPQPFFAFVDNRRGPEGTGKNPNEKEDEEERRMAQVRALQMSFYKPSVVVDVECDDNGEDEECSVSYSNESGDVVTFDETTGILNNLPLWRAPWQEVPGRSNVLNVHDPIYTSMFESILYQQQQQYAQTGKKSPMYFGHLYLEGGSDNLSPKVTDDKFQLKTWKGESIRKYGSERKDAPNPLPGTNPHHSSAVLGCLMEIQDFRRMSDGRLLLLVHAMERFVVQDVLQDLPHSVANVQLLPDVEELTSKALADECDAQESPSLPTTCSSLDTVVELPENQVATARARAVQESMLRFHDYEYDSNHHLRLPNGPKVGIKHMSYDAMARVLPYAPYANDFVTSSSATSVPVTDKATSLPDETASLESELLRRGIFKISPTDPEYAERLSHRNIDPDTGAELPPMELTVDELEQRLWIAISDFYVSTQKPISPVLLSLLPPSSSVPSDWPEDFVLDKIVKAMQRQRAKDESMESDKETIDITGISSKMRIGSIHDYRSLHADYPAYRRQRRLSYNAAYLLESGDEPVKAQRFRALLLSLPSTGQRLKLVLERMYQWQAKKAEDLGVFE
jgi:hypothetical protein